VKHCKKKYWVIPPKADARFVYRMERVLEVYERPYDSSHPVVCMDETPNQLIGETRTPIKKSDGTQLIDYEYRRNGTQSIFMAVEPLGGKRFVQARDYHKTADWVAFMTLLIEAYKDAEKLTVVLDNLSTHKPEAFYDYFPPDQAKAITDKLEFVFTPPHGSWLNIAEIELNVLIGQCLNRRIPDKKSLQKEIDAWKNHRDNRKVKIDWKFRIADARKKLERIYPVSMNTENTQEQSKNNSQQEN
jgi:hypothetical protein